jgi:hypothetical protein
VKVTLAMPSDDVTAMTDKEVTFALADAKFRKDTEQIATLSAEFDVRQPVMVLLPGGMIDVVS